MASDWITTTEYAAIARTTENTIRYWRQISYGPVGFRLGRRVLYSESEVLAWIESERRNQGPESA